MHFTLGLALAAGTLVAANGNTTNTNSTSTPTTMQTQSMPASTGSSNSTTGSSNNTSVQGQGNKIYTYSQGQCQDGNSSAINTFEIADGFPNFGRAKAPKFPGAEAKNGGGWDVYWSIPQPAQGCRTLVMLPFSQSAGMAGGPGGNEIINAGKAGCYFANIPTDSDVLVSYCCGSGDCGASSLNSTELLSGPAPKRSTKKRESAAPAVLPRIETMKQLERAFPPEKSNEDGFVSRALDQTRRWFYTVPNPTDKQGDCKIVKPGQPYSVAGPQVVTGPSQSCTDSPCTIAVNFQTTMSTTATSSTDTTLTWGVEGSVAVQAGVDFIAKGSVTATIGGSFSRAVSQTTGMDVMTGNTTSITNTLPIHLGNRGLVTFTPTYKCITGPMDCGKGPSDPIHWCQPDLSGKGGSLNGDFNAVAFA